MRKACHCHCRPCHCHCVIADQRQKAFVNNIPNVLSHGKNVEIMLNESIAYTVKSTAYNARTTAYNYKSTAYINGESTAYKWRKHRV